MLAYEGKPDNVSAGKLAERERERGREREKARARVLSRVERIGASDANEIARHA